MEAVLCVVAEERTEMIWTKVGCFLLREQFVQVYFQPMGEGVKPGLARARRSC